MSVFLVRFLLPGLVALALASCAAAPSRRDAPAWRAAEQMIVVTSTGWDADRGQLRRFERPGPNAAWAQVGEAAPVVLGRAGSAWGIGLHPQPSGGPRKREGDGRAPAGVFAIGTAFGYADRIRTFLPYRGMTASDYCIDVPSSPLYNRIVSAREVGEDGIAGSTEPMRRDIHADGDMRYRLGFVIEHNPQAQREAGSCIFAHLWKTPDTPTAGCTAMAEPVMRQLLGWLDPQYHPVFVLLPEAEYRRLRDAWQLPALPSGAD
jgi:L,D-peptidoglycan transpeptidase YkuD (ErfK/YbiS/YcfS/YnhG family)